MHDFYSKKIKIFIYSLFLILLSFIISYENNLFCFKTINIETHFSSLLLSKAHAIETPTPFEFQLFWNFYEENHTNENPVKENKKYEILTLKLTSQNDYYTYAPNQEGVYPTKLHLANIEETSSVYTLPTHLILYPVGKKKADPFNPNIEIFAYEGSQYIFLVFPENFLESYPTSSHNLVENLELIFTFLACTSEHCLPREEIITLDLHKVQLSQLKNLNKEVFFEEFQTLFSDMQRMQSNAETKPMPFQKKISENNILEKETSKIPPKRQRETHPESLEAKEDQKQNTPIHYEFNPQALNTSLEVESLYKALLFGLLAGFILNFMPCVLPVIGLKIRSFLQSKQEDCTKEVIEKRLSSFREHNLFFGFGILTWFLVLGFLLGVLGFSWGQIFQNPALVLTLTLFIFAMSLSLFGIYHLPIFGTKIAHILDGKQNTTLHTMDGAEIKNKISKKPIQNSSGKFSAFASGLLATLLATPCSGPLLGAVLGFSLTQPLPILLTIFLAMGFGMALPYFLFALRPSLVHFMPRAGNWLNNMEQILGFFLIATSIYLFSLLPNSWQMPALILTFLLAVSCTIWGKIGSFHSKGRKKILIGFLCIAIVLVPYVFLFQAKETKVWLDFTPHTFKERLGKELLILKFTADWCPTCKVLEHTVFTAKNMQKLSRKTSSDTTFLYVDLTEFEDSKQNLLKALNSVSIPLLAIFPKGDRAHSPIIIRDMYTFNQVEEAIQLAQ